MDFYLCSLLFVNNIDKIFTNSNSSDSRHTSHPQNVSDSRDHTFKAKISIYALVLRIYKGGNFFMRENHFIKGNRDWFGENNIPSIEQLESLEYSLDFLESLSCPTPLHPFY